MIGLAERCWLRPGAVLFLGFAVALAGQDLSEDRALAVLANGKPGPERAWALASLCLVGDPELIGIPGGWLKRARSQIDPAVAPWAERLVRLVDGDVATVVAEVLGETGDGRAAAFRSLAWRDWRRLEDRLDRLGWQALSPLERYALGRAWVRSGLGERLRRAPAQDPELPAWGWQVLRWQGLGAVAVSDLVAEARRSVGRVLAGFETLGLAMPSAFTELALIHGVEAEPRALRHALAVADGAPTGDEVLVVLRALATVAGPGAGAGLVPLARVASARWCVVAEAWADLSVTHPDTRIDGQLFVGHLARSGSPVLAAAVRTAEAAALGRPLERHHQSLIALATRAGDSSARAVVTDRLLARLLDLVPSRPDVARRVAEATVATWQAERETRRPAVRGLVAVATIAAAGGRHDLVRDDLARALAADPWNRRLALLLLDDPMPRFDELEPAGGWRAERIDRGPESITPPAGGRRDNFAVAWRGRLRIVAPGRYGFAIDSDDGARLYLDGRLVVDHSGRHSMDRSRPGVIALGAGDHDLLVEWYEARGLQGCRLVWAPPGSGGWAVVPESSFRDRRGRPGLEATWYPLEPGQVPGGPERTLAGLDRLAGLLAGDAVIQRRRGQLLRHQLHRPEEAVTAFARALALTSAPADGADLLEAAMAARRPQAALAPLLAAIEAQDDPRPAESLALDALRACTAIGPEAEAAGRRLLAAGQGRSDSPWLAAVAGFHERIGEHEWAAAVWLNDLASNQVATSGLEAALALARAGGDSQTITDLVKAGRDAASAWHRLPLLVDQLRVIAADEALEPLVGSLDPLALPAALVLAEVALADGDPGQAHALLEGGQPVMGPDFPRNRWLAYRRLAWEGAGRPGPEPLIPPRRVPEEVDQRALLALASGKGPDPGAGPWSAWCALLALETTEPSVVGERARALISTWTGHPVAALARRLLARQGDRGGW